MNDDTRPPLEWPILASIALLVFIAHLVVNTMTPYGIHRDELLYAAMGQHLRFFRMDFPPAIAVVANAERWLFGDSLLSIRLMPAIAGSMIVLLAAAIARELGGRRFAQTFAAVAVAAHPLFLRPGNLFMPVVLDQLWWTAALLALARFGRTREPRWWTAVGLIGGLGLLTKFSILLFGFGLLVALIVADRPVLRTRGPYWALAIALVLGSPSLIGQIRLGYPVVAQMGALRESQLVHVSYTSFLSWQLLLGPSLLLAAAGAVWLIRSPEARPFRILGVTCLAVFTTLFLLHGKGYSVGPISPTLFAAGAVWLGQAGANRVG
jgi:4-amino-4-deoxy-L-arabinose transferase-like glycosyltransferase